MNPLGEGLEGARGIANAGGNDRGSQRPVCVSASECARVCERVRVCACVRECIRMCVSACVRVRE